MEENEVPLREYIEILWKGKWIILIALVATVVSAALFSARLPEQYETRTKLLITPPIAERLTTTGEEGNLSSSASTREGTFSVETYRSLATANDLLQQIIDALHLTRGNPDGEKLPVESLARMMSSSVEMAEGGREARPLPLLTMVVRGKDPERIRQIADNWAALFIERNVELLTAESTLSFDFIETQYHNNQGALEAKEDERERYKAENPLDILKDELGVNRTKLKGYRISLADTTTQLALNQGELAQLLRQIDELSIAGRWAGLWLNDGEELTLLPEESLAQRSLNQAKIQFFQAQEASQQFQIQSDLTQLKQQLQIQRDKLSSARSQLQDTTTQLNQQQKLFDTYQGQLAELTQNDRWIGIIAVGDVESQQQELTSFLQNEIALAKTQLQEAEQQLRTFQRDSGLTQLKQQLQIQRDKLASARSQLQDTTTQL
ncbi:MAG: Wzz/FepE/Etk N-terminal domain-containing protein, partial [Candidatus Bipolaricaulia bacterium]